MGTYLQTEFYSTELLHNSENTQHKENNHMATKKSNENSTSTKSLPHNQQSSLGSQSIETLIIEVFSTEQLYLTPIMRGWNKIDT